MCHRNSLFTFGRGTGTQVFAWQRSALSHSHSLRRGLSCSCPMALSMCHAFLFRLYDRSIFFGTFFSFFFFFFFLFMMNISFLRIVGTVQCPLTRGGRRVLFNQPLFGPKDWLIITAVLILCGAMCGLGGSMACASISLSVSCAYSFLFLFLIFSVSFYCFSYSFVKFY